MYNVYINVLNKFNLGPKSPLPLLYFLQSSGSVQKLFFKTLQSSRKNSSDGALY